MAVILLLIPLLVPSIYGQCTIERAQPFFKRSIYEFSVELSLRIAEETENHFVASTFSPWTLLAATSLGAVDETLLEIKQALRLHHHNCFNSKFFKLIKKVTDNNADATLERSSTLFVDDRFDIKTVFVNRIKNTGVANVNVMPFTEYEEVAGTINNYVREATHGAIDDVVTADDLSGIYLVLIDALYFKGTWRDPFSPADTEPSPFYNSDGAQLGDVNLMYAPQLPVNLTTVPQIQAEVLELPYGQNDKFSMLIILPHERVSLTTVKSNMKKITLATIFSLFSQTGTQTVDVQIPKFSLSTDLSNLKELLMDLGLRRMFENDAQFGDISDHALFVSNIIQKARIEVNEEGTTASVASAGLFEGRSLFIPKSFVVNKPFLFMIVDRETEIVLFTGAYSKPSVY